MKYMGYKNICLNCKISFNQGTDFDKIFLSNCTTCGSAMTQVDQKFKPPKKNQIKKWEVVNILIQNGFRYDRIYDNNETIKYPEKMNEVKIFIEKYKIPK